MRLISRRMLVLAAALIAPSAQAHVGTGVSGGLAAGLLHPVTGLDHVLAMLAVGMWGACLGRPMIWALPASFLFMLLAGGLLGMQGIALPHGEAGIAASVIVLGLSIACAWKSPLAVALIIVAVFGLFHGHAHGIELPLAASPAAYAAGFALTTGLLHVAGIAAGLLSRRYFGDLLLRLGGAAISLTGIWFALG